MSLSIDIVPLTNSLDMYGPPDTCSAYSLSGHVAISVKPHYSLFERRSAIRLLLQSLCLTFEGQTEIVTPKIGYSATRLCCVTRELITEEPVELNNEGEDDLVGPCVWNVVFNLPIPGWLPQTSVIGVDKVGVKYVLHATAKFEVINDHQSGSGWGLATLCNTFRPRVRSVNTRKQILLRRYVAAPSTEPLIPPVVTYCINALMSSTYSGKNGIPTEILEKIEVIATVPEFVNVKDSLVPVTVRMRTRGLDAAECKRLQVTEIVTDITQKEKYRCRPSNTYLAMYPVPPKNRQPPNEPLLEPNPISDIYECGFASMGGSSSDVDARTVSFLPPDESGKYQFSKGNYVFADDATPREVPTWYTMEITVPFITQKAANVKDTQEWLDAALLPSITTPLYNITHEVAFSITCSYDVPGTEGESLNECFVFRIPIFMVHAPPTMPIPRCLTPPPSLCASRMMSDASSVPVSSQTLPPYSQLYDYNGERKIDYSIPLPLYEPSHGMPSSSLIDLEADASLAKSALL
ncbi:hypothetical protein AMATHDRAFT_437 [Amanita thiersii Skay4041]|uniref:Arrestin-like N-terminal domain-containing protein n=1 Tax=Amanita thiersii Skay4041 TaxID=703135 RepID=A0A2A9NZT9_9AGAR|nr:hypothetical protein AMATHDRAFT_437 [Amanita thiersii Skay4041]